MIKKHYNKIQQRYNIGPVIFMHTVWYTIIDTWAYLSQAYNSKTDIKTNSFFCGTSADSKKPDLVSYILNSFPICYFVIIQFIVSCIIFFLFNELFFCTFGTGSRQVSNSYFLTILCPSILI